MQRKIFQVTFAAGAALSGPVTLGAYTFAGVIVPQDWTEADITLRGGEDGVTYADVYKADATEYDIKAAVGQLVVVPPGDLAGINSFILRSGTGAVPVDQVKSVVVQVIGIIS